MAKAVTTRRTALSRTLGMRRSSGRRRSRRRNVSRRHAEADAEAVTPRLGAGRTTSTAGPVRRPAVWQRARRGASTSSSGRPNRGMEAIVLGPDGDVGGPGRRRRRTWRRWARHGRWRRVSLAVVSGGCPRWRLPFVASLPQRARATTSRSTSAWTGAICWARSTHSPMESSTGSTLRR